MQLTSREYEVLLVPLWNATGGHVERDIMLHELAAQVGITPADAEERARALEKQGLVVYHGSAGDQPGHGIINITMKGCDRAYELELPFWKRIFYRSDNLKLPHEVFLIGCGFISAILGFLFKWLLDSLAR